MSFNKFILAKYFKFQATTSILLHDSVGVAADRSRPLLTVAKNITCRATFVFGYLFALFLPSYLLFVAYTCGSFNAYPLIAHVRLSVRLSVFEARAYKRPIISNTQSSAYFTQRTRAWSNVCHPTPVAAVAFCPNATFACRLTSICVPRRACLCMPTSKGAC